MRALMHAHSSSGKSSGPEIQHKQTSTEGQRQVTETQPSLILVYIFVSFMHMHAVNIFVWWQCAQSYSSDISCLKRGTHYEITGPLLGPIPNSNQNQQNSVYLMVLKIILPDFSCGVRCVKSDFALPDVFGR